MNDFKEVTILIAEDNDGHAELIRENLQDAGVLNSIIRFSNGLDAWNFLAKVGNGPIREDKKSYLLLLDIRMPKMDGVDVLKKIKADKSIHSLPVIMLTTTNDPREINECYELGCNSYITKPVNYSQFTEVLKRLGFFISILEIAPVNS